MKSLAQIIGRKESYSDLLGTDEWRNYARSIRRKRGNACECCRRVDVSTQVHHFGYQPHLKPWEYPDEDVALLCRGCHESIHAELSKFRRFVFRKMSPASFRVLNGALSVGLEHYDPLAFSYAVAEMASSPGSVERFSEAWSKTK